MPSLDLAVISVRERANAIPGDLLVKAESFEQAIGAAINHTSTGVDVLGHAQLRMSGLVGGG